MARRVLPRRTARAGALLLLLTAVLLGAARPTTARASGWPVLVDAGSNALSAQDAPCARLPLARGWVARENAHRGLAGWRPTWKASPAGIYVDRPSLACGDVLRLHLGGLPGRETVRVVRLGWYGGDGARLLWTSGPVTVPRSPAPAYRDHVVPDFGWPVRVAVPVTVTWRPGFYLAQVLRDGRVAGQAAFVVRNDARPSPLVVVDADLTWAAYSDAGGANLYGPDEAGRAALLHAGRAYVVTLHRPTTGAGLYQMLNDDGVLAQTLERFGLAADHVLDTDVAVAPGLLAGHAGVVLPAHSEYWTRTAYQALQAAVAGGENLADLGANTIYWQARVDLGRSGYPDAVEEYRTTTLDPLAARDPALATVRWSSWPLDEPSAALTGEPYSVLGVHTGMVLRDPPSWLVAGTGATDGTLLPDAVQNEADGVDVQTPGLPAGLQVVGDGVALGPSGSTAEARPVSMSYVATPSGAGVFDAGSTDWLCLPVTHCGYWRISPGTADVMLGMTRDVLTAFSTPGWGTSHPSTSALPPTPDVLLPQLPPSLVGRWLP